MNKINWKVRFKNKVFLTSFIALLLVTANQIAGLFGYDITLLTSEITSISETVLTILALTGVIVDPTTESYTDSKRALTYDEPKKD